MVAFWQWMDIFRSTWKHRLVKNRGKEGVRCNLTFRLIRNHEQNCRLSSKWLNQTFLIFSTKWFQKDAFTFLSTLCCWNIGDDDFKVYAWHWKLISPAVCLTAPFWVQNHQNIDFFIENSEFLDFTAASWWSQKGAFTLFRHAMLLKLWGWSFQSPCMTLKTHIHSKHVVCLTAPFLNAKSPKYWPFSWK